MVASLEVNPLGPVHEIKYGAPVSKGTPPTIFVVIVPSLDSKQLLFVITIFDLIDGFTVTSLIKESPIQFGEVGVIVYVSMTGMSSKFVSV